MDYANLHSHHHQLQEQANILGHSTSSATSSGDYIWNTSINTLNNDTDLYPSETIPNSRLLLPSSTPTFMASQDSIYGFDHATFTRRPSSNEPPPPNIKEETSDSFSKLRININPVDQFDKSNLVLSNLYKQGNNRIIGLTNHDSSSPFSVSDETLYCNAHNNINASFGAGFTSFGHVFSNRTSNRTLNRASEGTLSPSFLLSSHEGFNNSQALDLLSSPRASNYHSPSQSSSHTTKNSSNLGLYGEYNMSLGHVDHHNMQVSRSSPSNTSKNVKLAGFFNEVTRTKRRLPSGLSDQPKDQSHNAEANKKSKSTSRSSNPPLKVRKEKLGDRISALHRLVAPFGKTDTASVLTEAIGYIQFLHDQVQTLSTPYMKSLQSNPSRKMQQVHGFGKDHEETEVLKMDLRSRGLCLVPLSCASYLNGFD